jgi:transposase
MIELGARDRVLAHPRPVDMRKGFNTLAGIVAASGLDVAAGDRFLFVSKDLKRAKCIWLDAVCARMLVNRIDVGRFAPLWRDDSKPIELTASELRLYLAGSKLVGKVALSPPGIDRKAQSKLTPSAFR